MKWNYRIVRCGDEGTEWYGLYEIHYQDGRPWARTDWAVVLGDSPADIVAQLEAMTRCAREQEILDDNAIGGEEGAVGDAPEAAEQTR